MPQQIDGSNTISNPDVFTSATADGIPLPAPTLPDASATYRGVLAYQRGGGGVADTVVCCLKSAAGSYAWTTVATG